MLPRPKRFVLIKLNHFLGIVETLGAGLQTPPRLRKRLLLVSLNQYFCANGLGGSGYATLLSGCICHHFCKLLNCKWRVFFM
ncbi:hypothetical protein B0F88_10827 [Methylobacter tundripaludum]|uniref:Uncharacterized protein n=1 Tax=Methylobacter tundripaludum TaxID=173365 RepID=A0A2S6GZJ6_9GAMM|nr:hypothetical protein B0F88_10827 [Methylobacter tundripaludum]